MRADRGWSPRASFPRNRFGGGANLSHPRPWHRNLGRNDTPAAAVSGSSAAYGETQGIHSPFFGRAAGITGLAVDAVKHDMTGKVGQCFHASEKNMSFIDSLNVLKIAEIHGSLWAVGKTVRFKSVRQGADSRNMDAARIDAPAICVQKSFVRTAAKKKNKDRAET